MTNQSVGFDSLQSSFYKYQQFHTESSNDVGDYNFNASAFIVTCYEGVAVDNLSLNTLLPSSANLIKKDRLGVYYVNKEYYNEQSDSMKPVIRDIEVLDYSVNETKLEDERSLNQLEMCSQQLSSSSDRRTISLSSRLLYSVPSLTFNSNLSWSDCVSEVIENSSKDGDSEKRVFTEGPFLNTPLGVFVENIRYDTGQHLLEVFAPSVKDNVTSDKFSFQRIEEFHGMVVKVIPKRVRKMKVEMVPPDSLRSDICIDEVLILQSRHYNNIYHNMEHINNLLHCSNPAYHCPRFRYVIVYDNHPDFHLEYSAMYDQLVLNTLPMNYRPYYISKSILKRLKDGLFIRRALIMRILTNRQNTFSNHIEAISVMKTAYRYLNISGCITKPGSLKLVYIQRLITRQIINERTVLRALSRIIGLEVLIIHLEDISPGNQIRLFSEADIAFGVHGAGFVNIVWMMPFSGVFDIMNPMYFRVYYGYMSFVKRLFYTGFRNVTLTPTFDVSLKSSIPYVRDLDVTVDVPSLLLFMKVMVLNVLSTKYGLICLCLILTLSV